MAVTTALASGTQVELRHRDHHVVAVTVGGGLRRYALGDWEILDGYDADELNADARGQLLIPWPNRLRDGRFAVDGVDYQLPLTEPSVHNAIHGLARWLVWDIAERDDTHVAFSCVVAAQAGYPWTLALRAEHRLDDDGLTVTTTGRNLGHSPCPYGAGAHPYLTLGADRIDDAVLSAPGATRLLTDDRGLPAGREPVDGTPYDFREPRPIGGLKLDTGYGDLVRRDDGTAAVSLSSPGSERTVELWLDGRHRHLMLFTGDSLPDPAHRRRSLGVEPMTCPPNGLATGEDVAMLAPGEALTVVWGVRPRRG